MESWPTCTFLPHALDSPSLGPTRCVQCVRCWESIKKIVRARSASTIRASMLSSKQDSQLSHSSLITDDRYLRIPGLQMCQFWMFSEFYGITIIPPCRYCRINPQSLLPFSSSFSTPSSTRTPSVGWINILSSKTSALLPLTVSQLTHWCSIPKLGHGPGKTGTQV